VPPQFGEVERPAPPELGRAWDFAAGRQVLNRAHREADDRHSLLDRASLLRAAHLASARPELCVVSRAQASEVGIHRVLNSHETDTPFLHSLRRIRQ
jgi:hypothetical protein